MSNDIGSGRRNRIGAAVFAVIGTLVGADLLLDQRQGVGLVHTLVEAGVVVLSVGGVIVLLRRMGRRVADLRTARAEADEWRDKHQATIAGLAKAIDDQFEVWNFTAAEKDIASLLLKGLSLREIADIRTTSERTVREQSRMLYRKANISGRHELSAFFLEDILAPLPQVRAAEAGTLVEPGIT